MLTTILSDPRLEMVRRTNLQVCGHRGIWPLNAAGMPPPGPDFLAAVANEETVSELGVGSGGELPFETISELYRRAAVEPRFSLPVGLTGGQYHPATFVPGHIWGEYAQEYADAVANGNRPPATTGPQPADVMVILKAPLPQDVEAARQLMSAQGEVFRDVLRAKGMLSGARHWYVTTVVKFLPPGASVRASWIKSCLPILHAELRMVRPRYILCVGADAYQALFPKQKVTAAAGRVLDFEYRCSPKPNGSRKHRARVMAIGSLSEAVTDIAKARIIENAMGRFKNLIGGADIQDVESDIQHEVVRTLPELEDLVARMRAETDHLPKAERLVAWDAEWQGDNPANEGAYLRTVQVSWAHKKAACIVVCDTRGETAFVDAEGKPAVKRAAKLLTEFMDGKRCVGHFLTADCIWLNYYGFDPLRSCEAVTATVGKGGKKTPGWEAVRAGETWLDTAIMQHAINETSLLGLEVLASWYTEAPRYDLPVEEWKKAYCKAKGIKVSQLEGFGEMPDATICPYSMYDSDVTRRIAVALLPLMEKDDFGLQSWKPLWHGLLAQQVIMTMKENGIAVDRDRIERLFDAFYNGRVGVEAEVRRDVGCPWFNIRSTQHVKEYLFGYRYNGRVDPNGEYQKIFPEGTRCLNLDPLTDTNKPPRPWAELVQRGLDRSASPSTDKNVLSVLAVEQTHVAAELQAVLNSRYVDQVLKSFLRPPNVAGEEWEQDDDGDYVFESGIASFVDDDGRVRTRFRPTAETGRYKSSDPNLQNISKTRDRDYRKILGDAYIGPLRSVFVAAPGKVLVEFDYKGAELFVVAVLANDAKMIDHATRSNYPDSGFGEDGKPLKGGKFAHPEYYDIHSNIAVLAFRLDCLPTKAGLDGIGQIELRNIAKTIIFGILYGRSAKAIAMEARKLGLALTVDDAQAVIDTVFRTYPALEAYLEECVRRAVRQRFLTTPFGRHRRFPRSRSEKTDGDFGRQAKNFPIQGSVADAMNEGLAHVRELIRKHGVQDRCRMVLQVHDAGMLEVSPELVDWTVDYLIPSAMVKRVAVVPSDHEGRPLSEAKYHFGVDTEVFVRWGEKLKKSECEALAISVKYAKA